MKSAWGASVALFVAVAAVMAVAGQNQPPAAVTWVLDNLTSIGDHAVVVVGTPAVVDTPVGRAVSFNGSTDGLFIDVNPLAGLRRFTVEMLVEPAPDGPEEQRFLHIQEAAIDGRALIELRLTPDRTWCLDTFLKQGPAGLTLIDRAVRHPAGSWHAVGFSYDGETMVSYVDGRRELEGRIALVPHGPGRTSIGVRQNRVSWFKGRIRLVRFTPEVLPAAELLRVASSQ